jgi:F-type H+-transporting ATPase subunit b
MFDIGIALPINLALFLCTIFILNRLLFRPLQAILDEREQRTNGTLSDSQKTLGHFQELFDHYRQGVRQAQLEAYALQDAIRSEMAQMRNRLLADARNTAESTIARMKESIALQAEKAGKELRHEAEELSERIASLVLQANG